MNREKLHYNKKSNIKCRLGLPLIILALTLTSCTPPETNANTPATSEEPQSSLEFQSADYLYTEEDLDANWHEETATTITLNGHSADIKGSGAKAEGSIITINQEGDYVLRGTLDDGQIIVDADNSALVRLVLDDVSLSSNSSAPIYAKKAKKTVVILAEGTENTVTDASVYIYADGEDEPNAAIFAKDDLSITGTGSLTVTGNYNNAIGTKDILCVTGGIITVTAVNDGLRGKDGVAILDGNFHITAENDGIKSNNNGNEEKGFVILDGGTYRIATGRDGIQAETSLIINGGTFDIFTGGGAEAAPVQTESFRGPGSVSQTTASEDTESRKGLKASTLLKITSGDFTIDGEDDAVHSNGDLQVTGGNFEITTGDDGFHADDALVIEGDCTININYCYEGIEGATVDINGGKIYIYATDDGINAAGGADSGNAWGGPMGRDNFGANSDSYIRITGGEIEVVAFGDGIDANGNLFLDGGAVYVSGPVSGADSALDSDGVQEINGGVIVAASGMGMFESPSGDSGQPSLVVYFTSIQDASTKVALEDSYGALLAAYTPVNDFQIVVLSAPELEIGSGYNIYINDNLQTEITLTDTVTTVSEDGSEITGGIGGMGGGRFGGNRFGGPGGNDSQKENDNSFPPELNDMPEDAIRKPSGMPDGDFSPPDLDDMPEDGIRKPGSMPDGDFSPPDMDDMPEDAIRRPSGMPDGDFSLPDLDDIPNGGNRGGEGRHRPNGSFPPDMDDMSEEDIGKNMP